MSEAQQTSDYPGALDSFVTLTDKEDLAEVSDINKLKAAVLATQTELGVNPAGSVTDVKTRLAVSIGDDGAIRKGTAFPYPGTPIDGQMFYRTDEDTFYVYSASAGAWQAASQLSNVLFQRIAQVDGVYDIKDSTLTSANTGTYSYDRIPFTTGGGYLIVRKTKFKKIAGVSTVTFLCQAWQSAARQVGLKLDIGGQNDTVSGTGSQTTPEWLTITLDVSALTNGTIYDVAISITEVGDNNITLYLGSFTAFGS